MKNHVDIAADCSNLLQVLQYRASDLSGTADKTVFTYLDDGERVSGSITFSELDRQARNVAAHLQQTTQPGDRVLLVFPPSLDYIIAFCGCVYAGVIAVPALPPANARTLPRLQLMAQDAQPRVALAPSGIAGRMVDYQGDSAGALSKLCWLSTDCLPDASAQWTSPDVQASDIVFLQYTSGSTGSPKGVMVNHANILANAVLGQATYGLRMDDDCVSWLPPHHDFGLIGGILVTLYVGSHCIQFPPTAFVTRPYRWLKALSDARARTTGAPNFAYEMCIKKITEEQKSTLDLSALEVAINGAERVRHDTLQRFADAFAGCGFRPEAFTPSYGLAESTLLVSASMHKSPGKLPGILRISKAALSQNEVKPVDYESDMLAIVSTGLAQSQGHHVAIVDPTTLIRHTGQTVGEIWVSGPSVAQGYWNREEESRLGFAAKIAGQDAGYLRTGDLGFILHDELYVTGRIKEMMIINGRNIYPQDVEATVERLDPAFRVDGCAVCSVDLDGTEQLVIIQEVESRENPRVDELVMQLRIALAEQHEILDLAAIVLIKAGHIPRTSSGKIQRMRCKELFLSDGFASIWSWKNTLGADLQIGEDKAAFIAPESETEHRLVKIWSSILDVKKISVTDNFFKLGGHSLAAMQLLSKVQEEFQHELTMQMLFENATIQTLAQIIDQLRSGPATTGDEARCGASVSTSAVIVPDPESRYQPFPLNDIQQAYWIGRKAMFSLGGVATHGYQECRISNFDLPRFNAALNRLIERHDMLRAIVHPDGTQQILEHVPAYQIKELDLREQPSQVAEIELTKVRDELSHQILDASRWPVFEFRATRIDEAITHLHISMDMLLMDAWSGQILARELKQLYHHDHTHFAPLTLSFRDYVLAEEALCNDPKYHRALKYWCDRLPDFAPAPELPLAKNPDTVEHPRFTRRTCNLPAHQWKRLSGRARHIGVTPSVILLTAFTEILARWSKQPQLTINLTLFNRRPMHPEVNQLIGDFTSLILVEAHADPSATFTQKSRAMQAQLWRDIDHAAVSGVRVLRELSKLRGSRQASMPVVFTSTLTDDTRDKAMPASEETSDLFGDIVHSISQTPQVWLDHQVFEHNGAVTFNWDAIEEIFPAGLLDDMFDAYCLLLADLSRDEPMWGRSAIDLLPPACHALQKAANATDVPVSDALLHELFDRQASIAPERIAVISAGYRLTYGELQQQAWQLGSQLQSLDAIPNKLIAVVMEKGWQQVVATLGILYAGAAYLPLDPGLPEERLHHILERAEVRIVLTQTHLDSWIEWPDGVTRVFVDRLEPYEATCQLRPVDRSVDDLAYVIYTSGSTGLPKGVMIDHRGAVNTILDIGERFGVTPDDRVLALSSLTFDLSVFDIFGTLAVGATIVMPAPQAARNPEMWIALIEAEQVSVWNSVPALLNMLVEYVNGRANVMPQSLRLVMLSGDWIPLALPDRVRALCPSVEIISLGGATEASIWSIWYPITQVMPDWRSVPYGKPLRNQRFHVLDDGLQPRPVWVPGQLYIAGIGLAKGYWRDADKTNASFIIHPQSGERLYRTGDMGRYLPDGNIEFLGREDSQVKVQGYRIELGEIEAALDSHPAVRAAIVCALGEARGDKKLSAYVVADDLQQATREILGAHLAAKLPSYMVPSLFTFLDALPLSSNGKVDRNALLDTVQRAPFVATPVSNDPDELIIVRIVEDMLKIGPIELDINLLYLGATSIDMVRISNALVTELGFRPKLEQFITNPSAGSLIQAYRQHKRAMAVIDRTTGTDSDKSTNFIADQQARQAFKERQPGLRNFADLPQQVTLASGTNTDAFNQRYALYRSVRQFSQSPIPHAAFADFLRSLSEGVLDEKPKYLYASAGGLYPVQTYIYVKPSRVEGIEGGAYYYHPKRHCLLATVPDGVLPADAYDSFVNRPVFEESAFALFFIAQMAAIEPMYGEKSLEFCQIEAGSMSQLLTSAATEHELGLCAIGAFDTVKIRPLFDLDAGHRLIYSMIGGLKLAAEEPSSLNVHVDAMHIGHTQEFEEGEV